MRGGVDSSSRHGDWQRGAASGCEVGLSAEEGGRDETGQRSQFPIKASRVSGSSYGLGNERARSELRSRCGKVDAHGRK